MPPKLPNLPVYWEDFTRKNEIKIDNATVQLLIEGKTTNIKRRINGQNCTITLDQHFLEYYLNNTIGSFCPVNGASNDAYHYLKKWIEAHYV